MAPGGCGKSRLALEVGRALVDKFATGAWLVELAPLADPDLLPQAIAMALQVREFPGRPLPDTIVDHLSKRNLLLITDN